jgi:hypothetical protein
MKYDRNLELKCIRCKRSLTEDVYVEGGPPIAKLILTDYMTAHGPVCEKCIAWYRNLWADYLLSLNGDLFE